MWTKQTKLLQITAFSVGITILNQKIIWKDDIEFVTEFPWLLGHPVINNKADTNIVIIQAAVKQFNSENLEMQKFLYSKLTI